MANVEENKGGRQTVADVNIVPFIDLMSVIIVFLLITAVWTQVSMIQLGSSVYGKKQIGQPDTVVPEKDKTQIRLFVRNDRYEVYEGAKGFSITRGSDLEEDKINLFVRLKDLKERNPEQNSAMITVSDDLTYNDMVQGMDALLQAGFPEIVVSTGG